MLKNFAFMMAIAGMSAIAPLHAEPKKSDQEVRRQKFEEQQQERIQALIRRGRLNSYQQLLAGGKLQADSRMSAQQVEAASRDAAIDLAALGFSAADVRTHKRQGIDLFGVARRFFLGVSSSTDAMLMADTIVVATAGQTQEGRARTDGFLSEVPFTVLKSLKGTRAAGDVIRVPLNSGTLPNGSYQRDFTDTRFTAGKTYLLVLSKNWYEQFVSLSKKQAEIRFTALPYDAYEVADNGQLNRRSHSMQAGSSPKDLGSVEASLSKLPERNGKTEAVQ